MIVEIDKSNKDLALKEIESLSSDFIEIIHGFYKTDIKKVEYLGMSKSAYKIIGNLNKMKKVSGSFKAVSHSVISNKEFAKKIWKYTSGKVNLKSPDVEFHLFGELVALKVWERKKLKKSHEWEYNHPTSTDPRIIRAMINISKTKKVFDPFCGAGGILLEAVYMGKKAEGIDIDPIQIKRAKSNLQKKIKLSCDNSFNKKWPKIIVTDLPYGRNSKIQKEFFNTFFDKVKNCKRAVFGIPSNIDLPDSVTFKTDIYIHKSLTKRIVVIEN